MNKIFADFDFTDFWNESEYARENYTEPPPSDELIAEIEEELGGYKLPASYIELMKMQNGGLLNKNCFPAEDTGWSDNHAAITGIMGIGKDKIYSLCGDLGSTFFTTEGGYPDIGFCIGDTPTAGHHMVMLDYRKCGKEGEPEVVYVGQDVDDYSITFLAKGFETFIRGLVDEVVYDNSEYLKEDLNKVENSEFSDLFNKLISKRRELDFEAITRNICKKMTLKKEYFAMHDDELSYLMYDIQFLLYSKANTIISKKDYLNIYPKMIALPDGNATFSTSGYSQFFVEDWLKASLKQKLIKRKFLFFDLKFDPKYEADLMEKLKGYE